MGRQLVRRPGRPVGMWSMLYTADPEHMAVWLWGQQVPTESGKGAE